MNEQHEDSNREGSAMLEDTVPLKLEDVTAAMNIALVADSALTFAEAEDSSDFMRGIINGLLIAVAVAVENPAGQGGEFDPNGFKQRGAVYTTNLLNMAKEQRRSMS